MLSLLHKLVPWVVVEKVSSLVSLLLSDGCPSAVHSQNGVWKGLSLMLPEDDL